MPIRPDNHVARLRKISAFVVRVAARAFAPPADARDPTERGPRTSAQCESYNEVRKTTSTRKQTACMFVLLLASLAVLSTQAAPTVDAARSETDCKSEINRLCESAPTGTLRQCIEKHRTELGQSCSASIDASKALAKTAPGQRPPSCNEDFVRVCKGVKSGELKNCLSSRRMELTEFCRKVVDLDESMEKKTGHSQVAPAK